MFCDPSPPHLDLEMRQVGAMHHLDEGLPDPPGPIIPIFAPFRLSASIFRPDEKPNESR